MYTNLQLDIIREFGRNELTEGAISIEKDGTLWKCDIREEWRTINLPDGQRNITSSEMEGEILGHIPNLEDVFRVAEEREIQASTSNYCGSSNTPNEIVIWGKTPEKDGGDGLDYDFSLPLLEQPESTLTQLLTLFKNV